MRDAILYLLVDRVDWIFLAFLSPLAAHVVPPSSRNGYELNSSWADE
jgi:hypothetical protein